MKKTGKQLPYEFSYEETVFNEGGRGVRQRVFLRLWDYVAAFDRAVALGHKPVYATRMKRRRLEGPFADRGNYHQVEYLRTEALNEQQLAKPFWFLEMYESDVFSSRQDPECARRREEFFRRSGYSLKKSWHIGQGMLSWRRTAWDPWTKLRNAGYGLFLPIDGMYTSSLMAHLIIRLQLVTGARLGEVQQIAQNPDCIKQLVNVGPKSGVRWLLRMVPKGYKQRGTRQNFYIDEATKDHLIELIRFLREKYRSKALPSVPFPGTGFKADRYLFQWSGQVMPQHYVMSLIRFLLHGIVCSTVDGKPVDVTSHLLRHAFATELASLKVSVDVIAQLLHQRDVNVTKYYSRPTASQVAIAAEAVFVDRIDPAAEILRSPPEIQRMLKEAEGKVGALTEVLGGTCVIGNMCPAKFACVGCVGNAPDPERRHQIQHKRRWAEQQQRWAEKEGMLAEHRQMRQLVEDCDAILREMDVMEKVKADASQLVRIDLAGKVVQSERACSEKP